MISGIHYFKEIEAAVLGACMIEKTAFGRVYGNLKAEMLYVDDNQAIFSTLQAMYEQSIPIDMLTVYERLLVDQAKLHTGNIAYYLTQLCHQVVGTAHLEYHSELLKKFWRKRELEKITSTGFDVYEDERHQAYEINARINELVAGETKKDWIPLDEAFYKLLIHQQDLLDGNKKLVPTGFRTLDRLNGGWSSTHLIIIGARPSVGKSAIANVSILAAAREGHPVGIIALEMGNIDTAARIASIETETPFATIYRNMFRDDQQREKFYNDISSKSNLPIYLSDKTKVDAHEIKAKATQLKHKVKRATGKDLGLIVVDYLQLIESSGNKNYNREQEVAKISRGLKLAAMELQVPFLVLCQLSREVTKRKDSERYPRLSDLRESGAIEQDADVVLMLHRDWMSGYEQHPDTQESTEKEADLLAVKWRNGALAHVELDFEPTLMRFREKGSNLISLNENPF